MLDKNVHDNKNIIFVGWGYVTTTCSIIIKKLHILFLSQNCDFQIPQPLGPPAESDQLLTALNTGDNSIHDLTRESKPKNFFKGSCAPPIQKSYQPRCTALWQQK